MILSMESTWSLEQLLTFLFPIWAIFAVASIPFFGGGLSPFIAGTAGTLLVILVITITDMETDVIIGLSIVSIALIMVIAFIPIIRGVVWYTVGIPLVSLVEYMIEVPYLAGAVVLGLAGIIGVGFLYTVWRTGPAVGWLLPLRMVVLPLILAVLLVAFFTAVWRIIEFTAQLGMSLIGTDPEIQRVVTTVLGVGLLTVFVYVEFKQIRTIDQHGDATPISAERFPTLHAVTTKVASQLDVPVPTIAVTERSEPEVITVGYRSGKVTLIVSHGTLDALDDDQLEAVVAHELAHVANMDAMVMTVASLPLLLADGLQDYMEWPPTDSGADNESDTDSSAENESKQSRSGSVNGAVTSVRSVVSRWSDIAESERGLLSGLLRGTFMILRPVWWVLKVVYLIIQIIVLSFVALVAAIWFRTGAFVFLIIAILTKVFSRPIVAALSRARESAADRTAATVTGSPATLASALRTLDEWIDEIPAEDLRESSNLSSLSILPLDPIDTNFFTSKASDTMKSIGSVLARIVRVLFATHPPTERRIDALTALSEEQQTES